MAITDVVLAVFWIQISFLVSLNLCQDVTDIYHGCYFDGVDRALQDIITCSDGMGVCQVSCGIEQKYCEGETGMTVDFCRGLCRNRNLQYYALQAGNQCFCGGALSDPFKYTEFTENLANCSFPCSGDANQTCGGDFKMQVYEFREPVPGADCFHPGFVPNSYVSENFSSKVGEKVTFKCEPGHMILGEPQLTCQTQRAWTPNVLPACNYTGIFPGELTTQPPSSKTPETTTPASTTLKEVSPTTLPPMTNTDYLLPVSILIGVAVSVIAALLILFIAKRIRHNTHHEGTQQPDPNRNSSTVVNPACSIGNSENRLAADAYYSTVVDPSYESNLRGL